KRGIRALSKPSIVGRNCKRYPTPRRPQMQKMWSHEHSTRRTSHHLPFASWNEPEEQPDNSMQSLPSNRTQSNIRQPRTRFVPQTRPTCENESTRYNLSTDIYATAFACSRCISHKPENL